MGRALELAERGRGLVAPNPLVGAVVVRDGQVIAEGWHEGPGTPHAEVMAIEASGEAARGATLYCTLEPCDHYGRTPPCTQSIIASGAARVVVAAGDPHVIVDGRGLATLRDAGVEVTVGVREDEAMRQNEAYRKHVRTGLPFVTLKLAATLDGKTAASDGTSRWITGEDARADVHRLRASADAIVVGSGTALADDPSLMVRHPEYRGEPVLRVLVDGSGRVSADHRLFDASGPTLVATTERAAQERRAEWRDAGADVLVLESEGDGRVPLQALLRDLGKRDLQAALLEGGATLAWGAVSSGIVDKLVLYLAPVLAGGAQAPGVLGGDGFSPITEASPVRIRSVRLIGSDLRVEADVHRDS